MKINQLRTGAKLGLAFGLITVLTVLLAFVGWLQMHSIQAAAADLGLNWLPSVQAVGEVRIAANRARRTESELFLSDRQDRGEKYRLEVGARMEALAKSEAHYAPLVTAGDESRLFEQYKAQRGRYEQSQQRLLTLPASSRDQVVALFLGESETAFDAMASTLGEMAALNRTGGDKAEAASREAFSRAQVILGVLLLVVVALAIALAAWITRLVTRPIQQAVLIAQGVSAGDLTMKIEADGSDEPAHLMRALSAMRASLESVVADVRSNAEGVSSASAEIAQGNHDLSSRTEQQASALEETAASMEELGSTVRTNADNAQRANEQADSAAGIARRSAEEVEAMVGTMKTIDASSRSIGEIIGVIDSIAFQTNILALNAAVEAARAGEQGRGFAVVASEVRSLAKRSADAARQVKDLVAASAGSVAEGSRQAGRAGTSMREVVASIAQVAALVEEISVATREQSAGIEQVGEAVTQMDQTTQQNAALVEQSAAASSGLSQQAEQLVASVAVFRLPGGTSSGARAPARSPARDPARAPAAWAVPPVATLRRAAPAPRRPAALPLPASTPASTPAHGRAAARPAAVAVAATDDDWSSF